ncbi:BA14K family protein [Roseibium salinum]|uniref:Lectin-like protein BA14k n=1 Tax=Roseibium salinum TaxID=1604349 RepID=A0ABT3R361_9HYPH|nr:BA14K family protein [Roseibium sp. DSM 29163]MCX2723530.1 BA14K family protein [Roseibium sp. DSM 29163]
MPDLTRRIEKRSAFFRRMTSGLKSCAVAALLVVTAGSLTTVSGTGSARADGIYFSGGGIGFSFGTGGYRAYRGSYFYGPRGFYGPPYRPYGAPNYYHPYDMRAYPYRSRVYVNPPRSRIYLNPPRYSSQPQRVPYTKTGLAPFTPQWVAYCSRKFKSFNPNTGTYLAYSGKYRFCR